jgi:hypothetical protein
MVGAEAYDRDDGVLIFWSIYGDMVIYKDKYEDRLLRYGAL